MILHLVDKEKHYEAYFDIENNISYYDIWYKIDEILNEKGYSFSGYTLPEINGKVITIHWFDINKIQSNQYIEITNCEDNTFDAFKNKINNTSKYTYYFNIDNKA